MFFNPMRSDFDIRARKSGRALPFVCSLLIFSFILFNVLDVDGSNRPKETTPVETCIVSSEAPSDAVALHRLSRAELWEDAALLPDGLEEDARPQAPELLGSSPFNRARAHGYHAGLPRDALSDVLPA
jgi:hypothetical protein